MTLMVSAGRGKGVMIFAATGGFARSPRFHRPRASGYADILSLPRIGGRLSLPPLETLMRLPRCPRPAAIVGPALLAGLAAALALAPLQDVLRHGSEARMNMPGSDEGNWSWRFGARDLTAELAADLRSLTVASRRLAP
jgi:hypothetical protein